MLINDYVSFMFLKKFSAVNPFFSGMVTVLIVLY